jgi:hypothetical protein
VLKRGETRLEKLGEETKGRDRIPKIEGRDRLRARGEDAQRKKGGVRQRCRGRGESEEKRHRKKLRERDR